MSASEQAGPSPEATTPSGVHGERFVKGVAAIGAHDRG